MKYLLVFLFLIFVPIFSFAQLKGKYCVSLGYDQECITFLENNNFEYSYYTCGLLSYGSGKYDLNNGNLTLTFNDPYKDSSKYTLEIEKKKAENDSVKIEVFVFNFETKESLGFAGIHVRDEYGKHIKNMLSNADGYALMYLKKNHGNLILTAKAIAMETAKVSLVLDSSYSINIYLKIDPTN